MVRGRLTTINGVEVSAASYTDDRAQRLVDREFNLSMRADLPEGNQTQWRALVFSRRSWRQGSLAAAASVEDGLAKTLGLSVGDRIEFVVAGENRHDGGRIAQGQLGYHARQFLCPDAAGGPRGLSGKLDHQLLSVPRRRRTSSIA
jgi:hypothetical protein